MSANVNQDKPLSPNTKVINQGQAPGSTIFNQTGPISIIYIKFQNDVKNKNAQQENISQPYSQTPQVQGTQNQETVKGQEKALGAAPSQGVRTTSHGSTKNQNYGRQQNFSNTPKNLNKFQYSNAIGTQLVKQGSNNNLRNKYNRNQQQIPAQTSSQGRSNTGSKSSSSKNLLNKTQQQIPSHILQQANAQYQNMQQNQKAISNQRRESIKNTTKEKPQIATNVQSSRTKTANNYKTNDNENNGSVVNANKNTLNEYKQFMEKQKQMLKQLQANKIALMLNAFSPNSNGNQPQQLLPEEAPQSQKTSNVISKINSPKNQPSSSKNALATTQKITKQPLMLNEEERNKGGAEEDTQKAASPKIQQPLQSTPRTQMNEIKGSNPQNQKTNNPPTIQKKEISTPRQQIPQQEVKEPEQPQQEQKQDNDDSMCFSKKSSLDEYIIGKQIGQGAYAVVRLGLHKPSNKKVAMKIYKKYKLMDPNRRKSVKREIKLMEKMKHPNIIRLYEVIDTSKYVILVMEYVGGGSLHGYLKSKPNRRLEEEDAKRIFTQVLDGIKYCHSRCITHRDIKLENLLLDDQNNIKIIDFGFSTCIPNDKKIKIFCGTPSYMAPEIVQKLEYAGPPADIWALGVLLFTILSGCFPYRGATDKELYKKIMRADYRLPSEVQSALSSEAVNLLKKLFHIDAIKRPIAKEVLMDPWLVGYASCNKRSLSIQPSQQTQQTSCSSGQHAYKKSHTVVEQEKDDDNYQTGQKPALNTQQAAFNAYFGNNYQNNQHLQINVKQNIVYQKELKNQNPYQDASQFNINSSFGPISQQISARNPYLNNSNIPSHVNSNPNFEETQFDKYQPYNESVIQTIVSKLGYTVEEVKRYVLEENSFVSVLYNKLLEEFLYNSQRESLIHGQKINNSLSAKSNVQPSYIPSIASTLNQSNFSSNFLNNTQPNPLSLQMDRSRGEPHHHNYYGSYQNDSANYNQYFSQTMGSNSLLNGSVLSGLGRKDQYNHQRNCDNSLGNNLQGQNYDIMSSDEENISNILENNQIYGSNQSFALNNTQLMNNSGLAGPGVQSSMFYHSPIDCEKKNQHAQRAQQMHKCNMVNPTLNKMPMFFNGTPMEGQEMDMGHGNLLGGNNTQPLNISSHIKKNSNGQNDLLMQGTVRRQSSNNQQPHNLLNKNMQLRREFL